MEARTLLTRLAHCRSEIAYSRPAANDHEGVEYAIRGRLSAELINNLELPRDADAYLCGPVSFIADFRAALASYGLDPARIHIETFGAEAALTPGIAASSGKLPHRPAGPPGQGPGVSFARSGVTAQWGSQYGSLLELAEACDVPARWSCRTGVCHTCETALLSGAVSYEPEPLEPPADGNVLSCSTKPTEGLIVDL